MKSSKLDSRLPRNFHQTFIPERQYLHAMLRFAASGKVGTYKEIADATGIPMGKSSGKLPAILDYCRGMGLIQLIGNVHLGTKQPELTPFGRIVFLEDPHLKERVTQWIAHLNLCGGLTGADAWHQIFFSSNQGLGMHFSRSKLEDYLSFVYGTTRKGIIGPIIRMYEDEASFRLCGALSTKKDMVVRRPAPIVEEFGLAYGAWILQLIVDYFPKVNQVTLTELDNKAGWKSIPGWNIEDAHRALDLIDRKGLIAVDRQMTPWIVHPRSTPIDTWKQIYRDLV